MQIIRVTLHYKTSVYETAYFAAYKLSNKISNEAEYLDKEQSYINYTKEVIF